jgi:YHS domain-containing protein
MPDQKVETQFKTEHNGRTVYFCCGSCVQKFKANPAPYLSNLPPENPAANSDPTRVKTPPPNPPQKTGYEWFELALPIGEFCGRHQSLLIYLCVVFVVIAVAGRVRCRLSKCEHPGRAVRWLEPFTRGSTLVILVLIGVCGELWREATRAQAETEQARNATSETTEQLQKQFRDEIARTKTSGKLFSWAWPQALHELPKGLKNTFYRGNDERSPKLFNGGNYRTVTFHVAARTEDGRDVTPGMNLAGQTLRMRLEIVRAPHTTPYFFTTDRMAQVFLLSLDERTAPPVALTPVTPEWRWVVEASFNQPSEPKGYTRLSKVWSLSVGDPKGPNEAIPHYCVQCVIHTQDGVVQPKSSVWMIPVYPSPILHGPTADREWFSDRPIPEIPEGKNVTDPKLLGIPEEKKDQKK